MDPHVADHVLSHVKNCRMNGIRRVKMNGMERQYGVDWQVGLGGDGHVIVRRVLRNRRGPIGAIEIGGTPAFLGQACIVGLASVDLGECNRSRGRLPTRVSDNRLMPAVCKGQLKLCTYEVWAGG